MAFFVGEVNKRSSFSARRRFSVLLCWRGHRSLSLAWELPRLPLRLQACFRKKCAPLGVPKGIHFLMPPAQIQSSAQEKDAPIRHGFGRFSEAVSRQGRGNKRPTF